MDVICLKDLNKRGNMLKATKGNFYNIKNDFVVDRVGNKICSIGFIDFNEYFEYL